MQAKTKESFQEGWKAMRLVGRMQDWTAGIDGWGEHKDDGVGVVSKLGGMAETNWPNW